MEPGTYKTPGGTTSKSDTSSGSSGPLRARVLAAIDKRICGASQKLSLAAAVLVCATPLLLVHASGSRDTPAATVEVPAPQPRAAPPIEIVKTRPITTTAAPSAQAPAVPDAKASAASAAPPPEVPKAAPAASPAQSEPAKPAPDVWSEKEIADARRLCADLLAPLGATFQELPPIKQDKCGTPAPVSIKRLGAAAGSVEFSPPAVLNCAMVAKLSAFVEKTLQPAAREVFGAPVTRFNSASGYVCRGRNGDTMANGKISEHALANALDVASFTLADGRTVDVGKHWGPAARDFKTTAPAAVAAATPKTMPGNSERSGLGVAPPTATPAAPAKAAHPPPDAAATKTTEALFLRRLHTGACTLFGTVLGPEANEAHREHFHFDLHARRHNNYCQ